MQCRVNVSSVDAFIFRFGFALYTHKTSISMNDRKNTYKMIIFVVVFSNVIYLTKMVSKIENFMFCIVVAVEYVAYIMHCVSMCL